MPKKKKQKKEIKMKPLFPRPTASCGDTHDAEWIRQRELEKPRPDYGTFLKDQELIELFPEAAEVYHVDDIRRA